MTATLSPEFIKARDAFAAWYDAKDDDMQAFIDEIADQTHYIIDEDEYDAFIAELSDYGITNAETFNDAYQGEFDGYGENVLTNFTETFCEDTGILGSLNEIVMNTALITIKCGIMHFNMTSTRLSLRVTPISSVVIIDTISLT